MRTGVSDLDRHPATDCDVLVIGSGAGGLVAAVMAVEYGLKVIVTEEEVVGGTSACSFSVSKVVAGSCTDSLF